eukprot:TRINITY_DN9023_c0_g1_i6.p1 TRINITY_DN9023_c0_g1~~TRINITY_DN9023_c0_g1_i6.p1  ORF type:complete len:279 (+),score=35.77 TRINITY_DN9023_c0_g1_i6:202-1038(+)
MLALKKNQSTSDLLKIGPSDNNEAHHENPLKKLYVELEDHLKTLFQLSCDIQIKEINDFQNKNLISESILNFMLRYYQNQMVRQGKTQNCNRTIKVVLGATTLADQYFKNIKFFDSQFDFFWKQFIKINTIAMPIYLSKTKEYILITMDKKLLLLTQQSYIQDSQQTIYPITQHIIKLLENYTFQEHEEFKKQNMLGIQQQLQQQPKQRYNQNELIKSWKINLQNKKDEITPEFSAYFLLNQAKQLLFGHTVQLANDQISSIKLEIQKILKKDSKQQQ